MAYATYTTLAVVCGSNDSYTSDRSYLLFTKDAGMIWATAKSVREERSKQRHALQDFSILRSSLVKGKSGWRIGSAEALGNPFLQATSRTGRSHVTFLVKQIRRYVQGETPLTQSFDDLVELLQMEHVDKEESSVAESLFLIRLLDELGYIAPEKKLEPILDADSIKKAVTYYGKSQAKLIEKAIEKATKASQL